MAPFSDPPTFFSPLSPLSSGCCCFLLWRRPNKVPLSPEHFEVAGPTSRPARVCRLRKIPQAGFSPSVPRFRCCRPWPPRPALLFVRISAGVSWQRAGQRVWQRVDRSPPLQMVWDGAFRCIFFRSPIPLPPPPHATGSPSSMTWGGDHFHLYG